MSIKSFGATYLVCRISLPTQNQHLRSLSRFGKSGPCIVGSIFLYEKVGMNMNHVCKNFKLLRVLHLWGIKSSTRKVPNEIGNLIHLRYLAIKASNFNFFPKAVGNLRNLLALDFRSNNHDGKIAFTLFNMTRIRHLYLGWGNKILTENFGLDKLKGLQTLKDITGGKWMMKEMTSLSRGIKSLNIDKMSSTEQFKAVYKCPSIMFDSLRTLYLDWVDDENLKFDLEKLENCQHLKKLTLSGRINEDNLAAQSLRFPPNIVHLELWSSHFQGQDWITSLEQLPNLKFLRLGPFSYEGIKLNFTAYAFPQLMVLMLHCLKNLEEWRIEEGALASLKELMLNVCPKLQRLPEGLKTITTLQQLEAYKMSTTFCKRLGWQEEDGLEEITIRNTSNGKSTGSETTEDASGSRRRSGEDFHIILHIPTITIRWRYAD